MASLKRTDSRNSVVVPTIQIGILPGTAENASEIAASISRVAPDRFEVTLLGGDTLPASWPAVEVLIVLCSTSNTNDVAREYIASAEPNVILSDWNIDRIASDRRIFYDVLEAHRDAVVNGRLPMRLYAVEASTVIVRREHLEIDGRIVLKPCMERSANASDDDFRIYYPASSGGGCKYIKTGRFDGNINDVRTGGSYIYEELVEDADAAAKAAKIGQDQRRYRKRDRMLDAAYKYVPGLGKSGDIPRYDDDDEINPDSDLARLDRRIYVVTTASLPWMTGTAVNPLLRAAYLSRGRPKGSVTLVIPWLSQEEDRKKLYAKYDFKTPADQEAHVREWLRDKAQMLEEADPETGIQILWYESRYHPTFMSIFSVEDICERISDEDADVCVLEEPEHLNWFRAQGDPWTKKFNFTVGIVHTNYKQYARGEVGGFIAAPIIAEMSSLMVRAYCNKVIKLSPVLQTFSPEKEVICNVHGVRADFINEGERRAKEARDLGAGYDVAMELTRCYFIGKILWAKGLDNLMHLEHYYRRTTGNYFNIDIVGDGPELEEIRRAYLGRATANREMISYERVASSTFDFDPPKSIREFRRTPIPAVFLGRKEHFEHAHGNKYKIFINASITEVLCTTTAEALAMGKFAIIPAHPSNSFFMQFPNCLPYQSKLEFAANLSFALQNEPEPLTPSLAHQFTWEAATDRFVNASAITMREERLRAKAKKSAIDDRIAAFHHSITKGKRGDVVRTLAGAGPVARQSGKWGPYLESVRTRIIDTLYFVMETGQDNVFLLLFIVLCVALYALWSTNILPMAYVGEL